MPDITFRFYEELNDFLPPERRKRDFTVPYRERTSVKDMIESTGVPHTEVDLILVDGKTVDFTYIVRPGDRISVYPQFESFDISSLNRLRPAPLRTTRFVLDTHLGKLARYLRLLGFDTLYKNDWDDAKLAQIAALGKKRIILTRDHGLLKRKQVTHGYFVRSDKPAQQAREVLARFDLYRIAQPFSRCTQCNGLIQPAHKRELLDHLPPRVAGRCDEFAECGGCGRICWKGSHYGRMGQVVGGLLNKAS